ncbi:MAG: DNA alkylation repair protein [Erysipelotrichaceae bacterium]|nr:DNA alkylation repair protein [Erysipelotrichaceae bacterium]
MTELQKRLFELQDEEYRRFTEPLIPGVKNLIGVRLPQLRALAKEYSKEDEHFEFMKQLPHEYHEENILHCFLIEQIKDYDRCIEEIDRFLPYVDNWSVSDSIKPKVFDKKHDVLYLDAYRWIDSEHTYTKRFGMGMLMKHYLDADFRVEFNKKVSKVRSEEYYVNMMIAWYFATALAKQWDATIPFLEKQTMDEWTHNKTIRKAIESYRISPEHKEYLRTLVIKKEDV